LLRNVIDVRHCLREQHRVLNAGGHVVALDTTQPSTNFVRPLIDFHLHVIIPNLGRIVTGDEGAYTYLPETTEKFLQAEKLAEIMEEVGFYQVVFRRLMFGTVAIHWGMK
jgi:demethylmenaquinone methyltransferase/2-methoxy-6-polyprenyl-1,4-benzoquinol methylase